MGGGKMVDKGELWAVKEEIVSMLAVEETSTK